MTMLIFYLFLARIVALPANALQGEGGPCRRPAQQPSAKHDPAQQAEKTA